MQQDFKYKMNLHILERAIFRVKRMIIRSLNETKVISKAVLRSWRRHWPRLAFKLSHVEPL